MGDFVQTISDGISGLVSGSIAAVGVAFDTIVSSLQGMLPGLLFPITVGGVILFVAWWLFKK